MVLGLYKCDIRVDASCKSGAEVDDFWKTFPIESHDANKVLNVAEDNSLEWGDRVNAYARGSENLRVGERQVVMKTIKKTVLEENGSRFINLSPKKSFGWKIETDETRHYGAAEREYSLYKQDENGEMVK